MKAEALHVVGQYGIEKCSSRNLFVRPSVSSCACKCAQVRGSAWERVGASVWVLLSFSGTSPPDKTYEVLLYTKYLYIILVKNICMTHIYLCIKVARNTHKATN